MDPDHRIRLLMLTNELVEGSEYGFRDEFERLLRTGDIDEYRAVAPRALAAAGGDWLSVACEAAAETRANVLLVLSPGGLPITPEQIGRLTRATSPIVLYWEGDPWGRRKPITEPMRHWAAASDVVFSVAGEPQLSAFHRAGASSTRLVLHTYCHVQFEDAERQPPVSNRPETDLVMVGSSVVRFGRLGLTPGAPSRAALVRRLQRLDRSLAVYGSGWRGRGARGKVAYRDQIDRIREARVSINWDHFPDHACYASDRLPISLLAGRVHVTTRHPGPSLVRTDGLIEVDNVEEAIETASGLLLRPWSELRERGEAAWAYARHRLSDREAARYMLRVVDWRLPAPPADPWERLRMATTDRDRITLQRRPGPMARVAPDTSWQ